MTTLAHLTLTTGHVRSSPRAEVGDDILAMLRPVVHAGRGVVYGLTITLEAPRPGGRVYDLGWSEDATAPDVRCVLCWDAAEHAAWWAEARALTESLRLAVPAEPATVPWLAAAIQPTALGRTPDQLGMLGDAERCVAWAILEEGEALPSRKTAACGCPRIYVDHREGWRTVHVLGCAEMP